MTLKQLIKNRDSMKEDLVTLKQFSDNLYTNKPNIVEVQYRIEVYKDELEEFKNLQKGIEEKCPDDEVEGQYKIRKEYINQFCEVMGALKSYVQENTSVNTNIISPINTQTVVTQSPDTLQNNFLPKIKLTSFKGDYDSWLTFKTNFLSIVHNNRSINTANKYNFLRTSLDGYARQVIDGIDFVEDQYEVAWSTLCKRFDKKRILANNHVKAIFRTESIQKGSADAYRMLLDETSSHLAALKNLKLSPEESSDIYLIYLINSKLDSSMQKKWEEHQPKGELPTLEEFVEFLEKKADALENWQKNNQSKSMSPREGHQTTNKNQYYNKPFQNKQKQFAVNLQVSLKCNMCNKQHLIYNCEEFLRLNPKARHEKIIQLQLCENCLKTGHKKETCIRGPCRKCYKRHNTMLHIDTSQVNFIAENKSNTEPSTSNICEVNLFNNSYQNEVLLSTVVLNVKKANGEKIPCRALLDSGAQSSLITQKLCNELQLPTSPTNMSIVGFNQVTSALKKKCNISIFSKSCNFNTNISCYLVPTISINLPTQKVCLDHLNIPQNITLADPQFNEPQSIDLLIGSQLFWDLILEGKMSLGKGLPTLHNTKFGWIISGPVSHFSLVSACNLLQTVPEDEQLKSFWELEEVPNNFNKSLLISKEETQCEDIFKNTTIRDARGSFNVQFPFKYSPSLLGESKDIAIKRFTNLEKKLNVMPKMKNMYHDFINEYIALGHMTKVSPNNLNIFPSYYLPHHGVYKEDSLTTKLRVVFDGSCPSSSGWSLNDLQFTGPKLQNEILDILLRFRFYKYVVSADISKMYRQINMHEQHRPLQRIVWREDPSKDFSIYDLNTVTYGTSSAPYLAIKCLQELAHENKSSFPIASNTILTDFYVDDLLTGSNDASELNQTCKDIFFILKKGGFILRKWVTNEPSVLQDLSLNNVSNGILILGENESSKTLGIQWHFKTDILKYNVANFEVPHIISKRAILGDIARLYDPMGLITPCIILFKIFIQSLWLQKLSWDDPIPPKLVDVWCQLRKNLSLINTIEIPRYIMQADAVPTDLHCFCDASQTAYAGCIYVRSKSSSSGEYFVQLLCAKSKVAPVKLVSIPRLELCAALLVAQLCKQVVISLKTPIPIYYWTDSQVALAWIKAEPNRFQVFVANRISQIQSLTNPEDWHYVNTKDNPADLASRGVPPQVLHGSNKWWNGPDFLLHNDLVRPETFVEPETELEVKKITTVNIVRTHNSIFELFSNINKLKRIIAYCYRFVNNCKLSLPNRIHGPLQANEINNSFFVLIKLAQYDSFEETITLLKAKKALPKKNTLSSLAPFLDNNQFLRVGGRLELSSLNQNIKHPLLLSSKHPLTNILFIAKHLELLHAGPQLLLSNIRQSIWVIGGRNLAKKTVHECIKCFKFKPKFATSPMGQLPQERINMSFPFEITGIDYAGPYLIKDRKLRNSKMIKCYMCVFVCFSTKAVHLEIVTDLTSANFLACLKRFVSRRGIPSHIYSDNGTTFVGANNDLREIAEFLKSNSTSVLEYCANNNITWHFIPPYSPNFGGLWEAAVKSSKNHIKRIMHSTSLTYEEFNTLIVEVEGILNSRPLFAMSQDPNDLQPICPSHFLIGRNLKMLPDYNYLDTPQNRLSSVQTVQKFKQQFWSRFQKEYVTQLSHSYKWKGSPTPINTGTLVLIHDENTPSNHWLMGRVITVIQGKDNVARVATIKTAQGVIKRTIRKLCPLPVQTEVILQ